MGIRIVRDYSRDSWVKIILADGFNVSIFRGNKSSFLGKE
jgi:hypothetical protein